MAAPDVRIAAVMASYNRKPLTLACIEALHAQTPAGTELHTYVLDDASADGNPDAVREHFPGIDLMHGDGERYWYGSMRQALERPPRAAHGGRMRPSRCRSLLWNIVEPGDTPRQYKTAMG